MTLIDFITAQSARLKEAGVSFGHGTTNAFDEAAWLVTWALGMPLDALETQAQRNITPEEFTKADDIIARRIDSRLPAAYMTKQAWLNDVDCREHMARPPSGGVPHEAAGQASLGRPPRRAHPQAWRWTGVSPPPFRGTCRRGPG